VKKRVTESTAAKRARRAEQRINRFFVKVLLERIA
jgi:hypothetical protein